MFGSLPRVRWSFHFRPLLQSFVKLNRLQIRLLSGNIQILIASDSYIIFYCKTLVRDYLKSLNRYLVLLAERFLFIFISNCFSPSNFNHSCFLYEVTLLTDIFLETDLWYRHALKPTIFSGESLLKLTCVLKKETAPFSLCVSQLRVFRTGKVPTQLSKIQFCTLRFSWLSFLT